MLILSFIPRFMVATSVMFEVRVLHNRIYVVKLRIDGFRPRWIPVPAQSFMFSQDLNVKVIWPITCGPGALTKT